MGLFIVLRTVFKRIYEPRTVHASSQFPEWSVHCTSRSRLQELPASRRPSNQLAKFSFTLSPSVINLSPTPPCAPLCCPTLKYPSVNSEMGIVVVHNTRTGLPTYINLPLLGRNYKLPTLFLQRPILHKHNRPTNLIHRIIRPKFLRPFEETKILVDLYRGAIVCRSGFGMGFGSRQFNATRKASAGAFAATGFNAGVNALPRVKLVRNGDGYTDFPRTPTSFSHVAG